MKTFLIKVENDKDAELLKRLLQSAHFESKIEVIEEDPDAEEMQMLEERWANYLSNPSSAISLDDFKKELKDLITG
jgi:hypothetical protein